MWGVSRKESIAMAMLAATLVFPVASSAQSVIDQYTKAQRPSTEIAPLDVDLFGEQVSLLDGSVTFSYTDVSVSTNSALPMTIGRTLSIQDQAVDTYGKGVFRENGPFGIMWDMAVPHLKVTVDARLGWTGNDRSLNRCSKGQGAPWVTGVGYFQLAVYESEHYYSGLLASIPGYGEEYLLTASANANVPMPADGFTYVKASKLGWRARCIPQLKRGDGEGFVILLPDGSSYKFDWLVSRPTAYVFDATCELGNDNPVFPSKQAMDLAEEDVCVVAITVPREENLLYATEATDRFGNKVTYTYEDANPLRLKKVESSDGASINLTYYSAGQIETIVSGGRTWRYEYEGSIPRLKNVVLPDLSKWSYEYGSDFTVLNNANPVGTWEGCLLRIGTRATSVAPQAYDTSWIKIKHPSGADGEFKLRKVMHGTKQTEQRCNLVPHCKVGGGCNYSEEIIGAPSAYQIASLYQKTISGPGMATQTWDYQYQPSWTAPYTSETVVTHSSGRVEKYKFGNDKDSNYGQLLQATIGTAAQTLRTENYSYLNTLVGQNFSGVGWDFSTSTYSWAGSIQSQPRPLVKKEVVQQGCTFIWEINTGCLQASAYCFDEYVRPLSIKRHSQQ